MSNLRPVMRDSRQSHMSPPQGTFPFHPSGHMSPPWKTSSGNMSPPRHTFSRHMSPPRRTSSGPAGHMSPPRRTSSVLAGHMSPPRRTSSGPSANMSPTRRASSGSSAPITPPPADDSHPFEGQQSNHYQAKWENDEIDDNVYIEPNLTVNRLNYIDSLLRMSNREQWNTTLSPLIPQPPNTTWFNSDKGKLVRKITKINTAKFDGPYYSWSCVSQDRAERYFVAFAKEHHWDPVITWTVQAHFEAICQRRMRDMVSKAHISRVRPTWIEKTPWNEMCMYWDTDESIQKSHTTSASRNSDRLGPGPHKTIAGQKSYAQIHQEMEEELGRPVSIGELYLKAHTKPDGSYIDRKSKQIGGTYQKNVEARMAELESETSDGTSRPKELTTEEYDNIFLSSIVVDAICHYYGLRSLAESHTTGRGSIGR